MPNPEKLNLSQICAAFAPVLQLSAANLIALGVPFEKDRNAVLMNARDLPRLADALIDQLYLKREEFLTGPAPRAPAIPAPAIQHLPSSTCLPTTPKAARFSRPSPALPQRPPLGGHFFASTR